MLSPLTGIGRITALQRCARSGRVRELAVRYA